MVNFRYKIGGASVAVFTLFLLLVAPVVAGESIKPRILLTKHLSLNLPEIKIEGKISLYSLNPLTGLLEIKAADGDPRRIFELISESTGLLHGLSTALPIKQLSLRDLVVTMTRQGVEFHFKSAVIPEGRMENVAGKLSQKKLWTLKTGVLYMSDFPFPKQKWRLSRLPKNPFPLGYDSIAATGDQKSGKIKIQNFFANGIKTSQLKIWSEHSGDKRLDISLDAEKLMIEEPASFPDKTGLIRQVMAYAGRAAQLGGLLTFDRMMLRSVANKDHLTVNPIRLSAPNLQIWGTVEVVRLSEPVTTQINLTAKRPGRDEKRFHWQTENKQASLR